MSIFYTSDLHLGNSNIIGYENRPWKTVEEMDAGLIDNWNQVVGGNDEVYVLGDFCFKGVSKAIQHLENLNGTIHLIRGNHDSFMGQQTFELYVARQLNAWCHSGKCVPHILNEGWYKRIVDGEHEVVLSHFPILHWDGQDDRHSLHLYGHMHSRPGVQHPHHAAFNVGVDVNDYRPVTLEELLGRQNAKTA